MRKRVRKCSRCDCTQHNQTVQRHSDKTVVIETCAQCERIYRRVFWHDIPREPLEVITQPPLTRFQRELRVYVYPLKPSAATA